MLATRLKFTTTYTYDPNGNLTTDGSKSYTFDYNNHLIQASISSTPTIATFSPMAGDGSTYRSDINWTTDHNATSATSTNYTLDNFTVRTGRPGTDYLIQRAFLPFDTSPLPDNAVITDTKLKVFVASTQDSTNDTNDFITLAQGSEQYPTVLNNADYDNAGAITNPTEGINLTERKDITNVPSNAYLTFNLNPTGQSWILKNAPTKLALREGHDAKNIPITGTAGSYDSLNIRSVEYAGTSSDPILEVTYTVPTTITYKYDQNGNRVWTQNASSNTYYPNKYYNTDTSKKTKQIYSGDNLISTIETVGAVVSPYYNHVDQINSITSVSDTTGTLSETLDYYPYGSQRINSGSYNSQRRALGQFYDTETGLNYYQARYMNGVLGRFISEDPIFLLVGSRGFEEKWKTNWRDIKIGDQVAMYEYLSNPQNLNSYSYSRNNPLNYSDPNGEFAVHFDFTTNAGLGGEVGNAWSIGFASDGTFGVSTSLHGGGLAGADASIGVAAGYSTAKTWSDTLGTDNYVSVGGKVIAGGNITTNFSNGKYSGTDIGVGIGARLSPVGIPITFSGGATKTVPVFQGSVSGIINRVRNATTYVTNSVSSVASTVSQNVKSFINKLKSK